MTSQISTSPDASAVDIKLVPQEPAIRQAIRALAVEICAQLDSSRPPTRGDLEQQARTLLERLGQPGSYLGFAMVAISNGFWLKAFQSITCSRRLFLLPHCLSDKASCAGAYDSVGLNCAGCGRCSIHDLKREAERLGYQVIVAEGTSSVLMKVLEGDADAILGVACLDSLEKSFHRIAELGVPHLAVPLLRDGCADTAAELEQIHSLLRASAELPPVAMHSYVPLLRKSTRMFQEPLFSELLAPCLQTIPASNNGASPALSTVPRIAIDWLREGGKRLRPFVTVAAYAIAKHGIGVLKGGADADEMIPVPVQRIALAIESMHKASLVHDDIEDDDEFRYGRQTLHRVHGIGPAVNVGDYLIGVGYRLISEQAGLIGADCAGDIIASLSRAHLELCCGQGAELLWQKSPEQHRQPMEVLTVYALKTSPAFEAALYAGLRAAGMKPDVDLLRRFSCYIGEGFQLMNDLEDWRADDRNKVLRGRDAILGRPTVLRAFAAEADSSGVLPQLAKSGDQLTPAELVNHLAEFYQRSGAFDRAEQLLGKLRARAISCVAAFPTSDLQELMGFLVRLILPQMPPQLHPSHP